MATAKQQGDTAPTLAQCLDAFYGAAGSTVPSAADAEEARGDAFLLDGDFEAAADAYAAARESARVRAKRGWCLGAAGQWKAATELLTPRNCGPHPAGHAMCARVLWRSAGFSQRAAVRERVRKQLDLALAGDAPPRLAFLVKREFAPGWRKPAEELVFARRACELYADATLLQWLVQLELVTGCPSKETLERALCSVCGEAQGTDVGALAESCWQTAAVLGQIQALSRIYGWVAESGADPDWLRLLSMEVRVHRVDAGAEPAVELLAAFASEVLPALGAWKGDPSDPHRYQVALVLWLAVAVRAGDADQIPAAAQACITLAWHDAFDAPSWRLWVPVWPLQHEWDLRLDRFDAVIRAALPAADARRWQALEMLSSEADMDAVLEKLEATELPVWVQPDAYAALLAAGELARAADLLVAAWQEDRTLDEEGDEAQTLDRPHAIALVAAVVERLAALPAGHVEAVTRDADGLLAALAHAKAYIELEQFAAGLRAYGAAGSDLDFYQALALLEVDRPDEAVPLYRRLIESNADYTSAYWNLSLALEKLGDRDGAVQLLAAAERQATIDGASERWPQTLEVVRKAVARLERGVAIERARAELATLRTEPLPLTELSLVEAVALLALNRACEVDRADPWCYLPYGRDDYPFEPQPGWGDSVLTGLARKGVIAVAAATPAEAWLVHEDQVRLVAARTAWQASPATPDLLRQIRECTPPHWPARWHAELPGLWRDLAVDECEAYLEQLCQERDIDPPPPAEIRPLLRTWLEQHPQGQVWYYLTRGAESASDYRAKYRASRRAVTTRVLNVATQFEAKAREQGWDTAYRSTGFVRSHLVLVLHEVLRGCRAADAFLQPIAATAPAAAVAGEPRTECAG